jgi:hypothetical protein
VRIPTIGDVVRAGAEQVQVLAGLPGTIVRLNRSLANLPETLVRFDQVVRRLDRLTQPLEGPLDALGPRLNAVMPLLDDDFIASLPAVLDSLQRAGTALEGVAQSQAQVAAVASSLERLLASLDESFSRFHELPGAALASWLRGAGPSARQLGEAGGAAGPSASATRQPRTSGSSEEHRSWRG